MRSKIFSGISRTQVVVLLLAVTALGPDGAVANLKAPVVINLARRTAVQVILDGDYPLRAPVDLTEVEDDPT